MKKKLLFIVYLIILFLFNIGISFAGDTLVVSGHNIRYATCDYTYKCIVGSDPWGILFYNQSNNTLNSVNINFWYKLTFNNGKEKLIKSNPFSYNLLRYANIVKTSGPRSFPPSELIEQSHAYGRWEGVVLKPKQALLLGDYKSGFFIRKMLPKFDYNYWHQYGVKRVEIYIKWYVTDPWGFSDSGSATILP